MDVSGIRGNTPSDNNSTPVTLYQLDTDIDTLQAYLKGGGNVGDPQYTAMANQLMSDSAAWVQQGNNSQQFPQFTAWVADAQVNGGHMSPNNPFNTILFPFSGSTNPSTALSTLLTALGGGSNPQPTPK